MNKVDEILKIKELLDMGTITKTDFVKLKIGILTKNENRNTSTLIEKDDEIEKKYNDKSEAVKSKFIAFSILAVIAIFLIYTYTNNKSKPKFPDETHATVDTVNAAESLPWNSPDLSTNSEDTKQVQTQNFTYDNLSEKYNYQISFKKHYAENNDLRTGNLIVKVLIKSSNEVLQTIVIDSTKNNTLYGQSFTDSKAIRSYITGVNKEEVDIDGASGGDFIIADFNFDGLEDFAIKTDDTNSGSLFTFYTMKNDSTFQIDNFLTNSVQRFPDIDYENKILKTTFAVGAGSYTESKYKFDLSNQKWITISSITKEY